MINSSSINAFAAAKSSEHNVVVQKFALAIGLVIFSVVIIYYVLMLYKKFVLKDFEVNQANDEAQTLKTPKNLNEAIGNFLENTKPDN